MVNYFQKALALLKADPYYTPRIQGVLLDAFLQYEAKLLWLTFTNLEKVIRTRDGAAW